MSPRDIPHDPRPSTQDRARNRGGGRHRDVHQSGRDEPRDRDHLTRGLDLPTGTRRERVYAHGAPYDLRGSETRLLAAAGTFRVVPADEFRDSAGRPLTAQSGDIRHLKDAGLIHLTPHPNRSTVLVSLTDRGRGVLMANRSPESDSQTFYARGDRRRELTHDSSVHQAYQRAADRITAGGGRIRTVVLEDEFRRDYQSFLQEPNRGRADSDGTVSRSIDEINAWAQSRGLSVIDDHLRIPDLRIEYDSEDGSRTWEDVEITTEHYRGAHAAATAKAGFTCYRAASLRIGGRRSGGGSAPFDPRAAERLLP